jgi:hypothetical protein
MFNLLSSVGDDVAKNKPLVKAAYQIVKEAAQQPK